MHAPRSSRRTNGHLRPVDGRTAGIGSPRTPSRLQDGNESDVAAILPGVAGFNDEYLARIARDNPGWRFEQDSSGALLVSPTFTDGGSRGARLIAQMVAWSDGGAGGRVYDSSTGFRLPDRALVSPDCAWLSDEQLATLTPERRVKYWSVCPAVVVEIRSETDSWASLRTKIQKYADNGALYAVAIDPHEHTIFALGEPPDGLALDVEAIINA